MPKFLSKPLQLLLQTALQILALLSLCSFAYAHTAQNLQALEKIAQSQIMDRVAVNHRVPTSNLYRINPNPGANYLVETDPRFTNLRTFLSSDYYLGQLGQLGLDPGRSLQRYGDGFLEQQLVNDQVLALTGRRYLSGYRNTEDEYRALMDAGVLFAKQYQLSPGAALSAEQMALLTTDIVWLVEQTITLADGSVHRVLAPQVYIRRPQSGDLDQGGALIAANDVYINSPGNLVNSGRIAANSSLTLLAGNDITNRGTLSGNDIYVRANNDLLNLGGRIIGTSNGTNTTSTLALLAGRDIVLNTTVQNTSAGTPGSASYSTRSQVDRVATISGTNITVQAGRDLTARAVQINADNNLGISAGRNVNIESIANTYTMDARGSGPIVQGRSAFTKEANTTNTLSNLSAGNNLVIIAGTPGTPSIPRHQHDSRHTRHPWHPRQHHPGGHQPVRWQRPVPARHRHRHPRRRQLHQQRPPNHQRQQPQWHVQPQREQQRNIGWRHHLGRPQRHPASRQRHHTGQRQPQRRWPSRPSGWQQRHHPRDQHHQYQPV
jgi:large exoprotein involved in heme utilization and adhesion